MTATLIDGKAIAARMRAETLGEAQALAEAGWQPRLISYLGRRCGGGRTLCPQPAEIGRGGGRGL